MSKNYSLEKPPVGQLLKWSGYALLAGSVVAGCQWYSGREQRQFEEQLALVRSKGVPTNVQIPEGSGMGAEEMLNQHGLTLKDSPGRAAMYDAMCNQANKGAYFVQSPLDCNTPSVDIPTPQLRGGKSLELRVLPRSRDVKIQDEYGDL